MGLPHFRTFDSRMYYAAICEKCGKGGNHYGYGGDKTSDCDEVHDFCSEHAKEYKDIYKKKIRKIKLEKIELCQKSS